MKMNVNIVNGNHGLELLQKKQEKSPYERLGGYNAITAVVDDFVERLVVNKQLGRFSIGHCVYITGLI